MKHLIFIVAYNHENFIEKVLERLPKSIFLEDYEILIVDDASIDKTFQIAKEWSKNNKKIKIRILKNIQNYGYGGNQKIGMQYAIKYNFDNLILLHGDGQYAPEILHELLKYHIYKKAALTLGSRMIHKKNALKGNMPLYKFVGNIILTKLQNFILQTKLSEFHTGYRIYSVKNLKYLRFDLNTNNFHFDTEIIIQHLSKNYKIVEFAIPTYYGDEISYVNGLNYAFNIIKESCLYRLQNLGIFQQNKYGNKLENYKDKSTFFSTHSLAIKEIKENSSIIDLGSSEGKYLQLLKKQKNCFVKSVNKYRNKISKLIDKNETLDLNNKIPSDINKYAYVLILDVIEHLKEPESFVKNLHDNLEQNQKIIASTGNISFFVVRLMLLIGFFNYGDRGILDKTHTRLFTFGSFKNLFKDYFEIEKVIGIPAPYPLAIGNNFFSKILIWINIFFIKISKSLFSYQMILILRPKTSLKNILDETINYTKSIK